MSPWDWLCECLLPKGREVADPKYTYYIIIIIISTFLKYAILPEKSHNRCDLLDLLRSYPSFSSFFDHLTFAKHLLKDIVSCLTQGRNRKLNCFEPLWSSDNSGNFFSLLFRVDANLCHEMIFCRFNSIWNFLRMKKFNDFFCDACKFLQFIKNIT